MNTSVRTVELVVEFTTLLIASDVSGPLIEKGDDTFRLNVYGGPNEPLPKVCAIWPVRESQERTVFLTGEAERSETGRLSRF